MKDSSLFKWILWAYIAGATVTVGFSAYIIYLIITALNKYIGG